MGSVVGSSLLPLPAVRCCRTADLCLCKEELLVYQVYEHNKKYFGRLYFFTVQLVKSSLHMTFLCIFAIMKKDEKYGGSL